LTTQPFHPTSPPLQREVSNRPFKIFAFADDANTLVKLEVETLNRLKDILDTFGKLSGLECNVEKTTLLQVGTNDPIPDDIIHCGFSVVTEVTILGLTLRGHGADTGSNLAEISNKLKKQVNHWARFNLSLPGRVSIAKTMLYSQINYLGCFLNIPDEFINNYSSIIHSFVAGKLKIAKTRFTKPVSNGGLGLIDLTALLDAQRISWIKHAKKLDDWWKISMYCKCYDGIYNIRKRFFDPQQEPCQFAIVSSYEKFITQFTKTGHNFKNVYLFENKALNLGLRDNRVVDASIFSVAFFGENGTRIRKLTTANLFNDNGGLKSRQQFIQSTAIPI
jgi:hypothetical protein